MSVQPESKVTSVSILNIIKHHKAIFETKREIEPKKYLNMRDSIFSLYELFCLLDDFYDDKLCRNFLYDILSLLSFYERTFVKSTDEKNTKLRDELISIIDTKLFYFDQLVCYKANNCVDVQNYLRTQHIYKVASTSHFLEVTKREFKNIIATDYASSNIKLATKYSKEDVKFILSTPGLNKEHDKNDYILDRLVKSKSKIALFRDMDDDDIKNLIHIFKFTNYKPGEVIINEGEMSTDIFFLLSGQCSATVNRSSVGTLKKNQIFGEFAFLLQQPRSATIRATKETVIIKFRFDEKLFRENPFTFSMLYKNITEELIKKIVNMNNVRSC